MGSKDTSAGSVTESAKLRVVLADDHVIVRQGLRALLEATAGFEIVAEASDGLEAVAAAERESPDIVVLDLSMAGLSGIEALRRIKASSIRTRVLVLSMHSTNEYVRAALRAGADGYVVKGSGIGDLTDALKKVVGGQKFLSPEIERAALLDLLDGPDRHVEAEPLAQLTPREREVLQLVAEGHSNRSIAERLGLSVKTVDGHRTRVMNKLDLHEATALTRFAIRHGLVSADH
jgi:DNA-binding NarL/FixJ family response regulator